MQKRAAGIAAKGYRKNTRNRLISTMSAEFWKTKSLEEMTEEEWEALCDGCATCCLIQLEDEDTGERVFTKAACRLLDIGQCQCSSYENRVEEVPNCSKVTPELLKTADWLPPTCAYRLVYEGKPLYWWHPLVSKDPNTVHEAGISIRNWARSETNLTTEEIQENYLAPNLFARFIK